MKRKKEHCYVDGKRHEVSPSMAAYNPGKWLISVCDVCRNYDKEAQTCAKKTIIPQEYKEFKKHDCEFRDINYDNSEWQLIRKELGL